MSGTTGILVAGCGVAFALFIGGVCYIGRGMRGDDE